MATDLKGRKVVQFRTHIDPMIGPKPRNAFDLREITNGYFELTPVGVYVKLTNNLPGGVVSIFEHIVPYANVQSIKLGPAENDK